MIRILILTLLLGWGAIALSAQTPVKPEKESKPSPQEKAETLLKEVDKRIHYPSRVGLKDLQFDWKISGAGPVANVLDGLYLRYSWKQPDLWMTGLVNRKGVTIEAPDELRDEAGQQFMKGLSRGLHGMATQVVVGRPLSEIYSDYNKTLRSREVNHKLEHRIILTPKAKKRYVKIVIKIVDGLPRELRKTAADGRQITTLLIFDRRGDRDLLTSMKLEENNRLQMQEVFHYGRQGGIDIVTGLDRYLNKQDAKRLGREPIEKIRFERMRVNQGLTDTNFGVEKVKVPAKKPTEKPAPKKN